MITEEIINFFTSTDGFIRADERMSVDGQEGVYACYSDLRLLKETSQPFPEFEAWQWRLPNQLLLYVGSVTKRPIKRRLYYHAGGGRADQSAFQMRLGCLLRNSLDIQLVQGTHSNFFKFVPSSNLKKWISDYVWFKVAITDHADEREKEVIQRLMPPFNVEDLPQQTGFHLAIDNIEKTLRRQAK
jgi:hypothetical protein